MRLFVSLPPTMDRDPYLDGESYAETCIKSWTDNGFSVSTVNRRGEAFQHKGAVDLVEVNDTGVFPGRYGPSFGEIFSVGGDDVYAITNADIRMGRLACGSNDIAKLAQDGLVFSHRIDEFPGGALGSMMRTGVDFVAFCPKPIANVLSHPGMRQCQLGSPWWDYILPVAASFFAPVTRIESPFIYHMAHAQKWCEDHRQQMGRIAINTLTDLASQANSPLGREFAWLANDMKKLTPNRFGSMCVDWISSDRIKSAHIAMDQRSLQDTIWRMTTRASAPSTETVLKTPLRMLGLRNPSVKDAWAAARSDVGSVLALAGRTLERAIRPYAHLSHYTGGYRPASKARGASGT
jgi:hypothetical protein